MDLPRNNHTAVNLNPPASMPSKDEFISLQSLSEALRTFNSLAESGSIPPGHFINTAKEIIPALRVFYKELLQTVFK